MGVQTRLEAHFLSTSLPRPRFLWSLSFPAGSGGARDSDSAPALEAKHGGVRGRLSTLPRVVCGVRAPRGVLPQPLQGIWRSSGRPRPPGSTAPPPLLRPRGGNGARSTPGPGRGRRLGGAASAGEPASPPEGPDGRARCLGPFGRGPASLSAASPCPPCSGNRARAAGRRARPSR